MERVAVRKRGVSRRAGIRINVSSVFSATPDRMWRRCRPSIEGCNPRVSQFGWMWRASGQGEEWDLAIKRALRTSQLVIVFLSNSAVSREGYLQDGDSRSPRALEAQAAG